MKYVMALIISVSLLACTSKIDYLKKDDLLPHVTYTWEGKISYTKKYYITEIKHLKKARYPVLYVGTVDDYHLFSLAPKGPVKTEELRNFAVKKESCVVENPKKPDDERLYRNKYDRPRWTKIEKKR